MAVNNRDELYEALGRADFDALLGTKESEWVDFKQRCYDLSSEKNKYELAKDVTAMANTSGGVIVLGVATSKEAALHEETASKILPVKQNAYQPSAIRDVVRRYTYPPLDINCRWWPTATSQEKGIATIAVEPLVDGHRPAIVAAGMLDSPADKLEKTAIAVFQRSNSDNHPVVAPLVHDYIRTGRQVREQQGSTSPPLQDSEFEELTDPNSQLLDDQIACKPIAPYLWIQASPLFIFEWPQLSDMRAAARLIDDPPPLRPAGFNLDFAGNIEPLAGGGLRKTQVEFGSLSVRSNGLTTLVIGYPYLGWAMDSPNVSPRFPPGTINAMVLVELVTEFVRFYASQVVGARANDQHRFRLGLAAEPDGPEPIIFEGPVRRSFRGAAHRLAQGRRQAQWEANRPAAPWEETAFALLKLIYRDFGIGAAEIPYTDGAKRVVSEDFSS